MISRYLNHFRQSPGSVVFEPAVDANLTKIDAELTARKLALSVTRTRMVDLASFGVNFSQALPLMRMAPSSLRKAASSAFAAFAAARRQKRYMPEQSSFIYHQLLSSFWS